MVFQGLVNVPFWEYWTSPYSSHYRPLIPIMESNGWVMWKMGTWLMTHDSWDSTAGYPGFRMLIGEVFQNTQHIRWIWSFSSVDRIGIIRSDTASFRTGEIITNICNHMVYFWGIIMDIVCSEKRKHVGVSEKSVPHCTQWFCWSLSRF